MKYLFCIIMLLVLCVNLYADKASGSFTLNTTATIEDNTMDELDSTQNQGSWGLLVGQDKDGGNYYDLAIIIRAVALEDSIPGRIIDTAKLTLDINSVTGSAGSADTLFVWAIRNDLRIWNEGACTWVKYNSTDNWTTSGAKSTASDIYALCIDSLPVEGYTADSTIVLDLKTAHDSGWTEGVVIRWGKPDKVADYWFNIWHSELLLGGNPPEWHVAWTESEKLGPHRNNCDEGITGANDAIYAGMYTANSFDASVDSINIFIHDQSQSADSVRAVVYRAYGDSTLVDSSSAKYATDAGSTCEEISFAMDCDIKGDSDYFWGIIHYDESSSNSIFCRIGGGSSGDAIFKTATTIPANVQGASAQNRAFAPCFMAYITETVAGTGSQVIIIGSCENEETPYWHKSKGYYCNIPEKEM